MVAVVVGALLAAAVLAAWLGCAGVALARRPPRQVMAVAANGLALPAPFMALQAPEVAFCELTVGTAVLPAGGGARRLAHTRVRRAFPALR